MSHIYQQAGTFLVTVTATDITGERTTIGDGMTLSTGGGATNHVYSTSSADSTVTLIVTAVATDGRTASA